MQEEKVTELQKKKNQIALGLNPEAMNILISNLKSTRKSINNLIGALTVIDLDYHHILSPKSEAGLNEFIAEVRSWGVDIDLIIKASEMGEQEQLF